MNYIELRNGYSIPAVGMGTGWMNTGYKNPKYLAKRIFEELNMRIKGIYSKEQNYTVSYELRKLIKFKRCISQVAKVGYTLFDVANNYNNLALVSQGIDLKNNRDKYIIISKCSNTSQRNGTVREEFEKALKELDTDYLDVFLIHWPQTNEYLKTWHVLEELYEEGKVKAIGVSNFNIHHLEEIRKSCKIMPMINEFECHPLLQQSELRSYCRKHGIQVIAHTPTGKMRSGVTEGVLEEISEKYNKSIAQVILRWHYQLGNISVPNTLNIQHAKENINIFDFSLSALDMEKIEDMDCGHRIWPDPDNCDFTKL